MKKINFKILIITFIACLLPIISGILYYDMLPEQIAVHFDINNTPDRYASKEFALFGIPIFLGILQVISCIISDLRSDGKNNIKFIEIVKWCIPLINFLVYFIIIQIGLGNTIDIRRTVLVFIGILFVILGNYIPKINFTSSKAIMHPAPKNEETYRKFSRILGYSFVFGGFLMALSTIFSPIISAILIISIVLAVIVEMLYYLKQNK